MKMLKLGQGTWIYLLTLGIFIAGLWGILHYGNTRLVAPPDFSGQWHGFEPGTQVRLLITIEQSGHFLRLHWKNQTLDFTLESISPDRLKGAITSSAHSGRLQRSADGKKLWIMGLKNHPLELQRQPPSS